MFSLEVTTALSIGAGIVTYHLIPKFSHMFIKANLYGIDLNKSSGAKVPEATGVVTGCVFLMVTFLMIPLTYSDYLFQDRNMKFPHEEFVQLIAALLSMTCMLLLGFADDVLDLRWRHKLLLPSMASLPMLMVYYVTENRTEIVVPLLLRGFLGTSVQLGFLYYVYMGLLAVFATNAINILAGINGLEVGQSLIIAVSVMVFNLTSLSGLSRSYHEFSLYFILPYIGTTTALLAHNWYPSKVFAGDTFCYFSGMTFAVVSILGHFSKTLLLFFIPQILNFLYSLPQLFHILPCPRHRLPKYIKEDDKVTMSTTCVPWMEVKPLGKLIVNILSKFGFLYMERKLENGVDSVVYNNLTIINLILKFHGPMHEQSLTLVLLVIQFICSIIAFMVRYPLAHALFGEIVV
eukprot:TRINITY_DN5433_c0_g1_i9.p1 TRINITY_DN5433_c0_g1~~TRINITY_DN5433_c0_g1_i9.p1  ORF type:complete len:405 (-),score=32.46 TRINITY_DN5433_c0_g1_i9:514-1728(-)